MQVGEEVLRRNSRPGPNVEHRRRLQAQPGCQRRDQRGGVGRLDAQRVAGVGPGTRPLHPQLAVQDPPVTSGARGEPPRRDERGVEGLLRGVESLWVAVAHLLCRGPSGFLLHDKAGRELDWGEGPRPGGAVEFPLQRCPVATSTASNQGYVTLSSTACVALRSVSHSTSMRHSGRGTGLVLAACSGGTGSLSPSDAACVWVKTG